MPPLWKYENGKLTIKGIKVINPGDEPWVKLADEDGQPRIRANDFLRMITIHTTKGIDKQYVKPGKGPGGRGKSVAQFWQNRDKDHSAAQIIVDNDGTIVIIADPAKWIAYHATSVNDFSIGIEMFQEADGGIYEIVLQNTVTLVRALCDIFGIPLIMHSQPYRKGQIIERLKHEDTARKCAGVFGHRDNSWKFPNRLTIEMRRAYPFGYANRSSGDPGDEIMRRLKLEGALLLDFTKNEDTEFCKRVQREMNAKYGVGITKALGKLLVEDGEWGPKTVAMMRMYGLWNGGVFGAEFPVV